MSKKQQRQGVYQNPNAAVKIPLVVRPDGETYSPWLGQPAMLCYRRDPDGSWAIYDTRPRIRQVMALPMRYAGGVGVVTA